MAWSIRASPVLRLFALVATVALLTSRVMLLVHEFVGHALPATLFGGRVTGWFLFMFAGGRVSYRFGEIGIGSRLVVSLGGIAVELGFGALAFFLARRQGRHAVASFCFLCVGTVLIAHASMYLARGVHYGFGDGALLARRAAGLREVIVLAASALAVGAALGGGRRLVRLPATIFVGTPRRVAITTLVVFACAGLFHGALAFSEVRWFPDPAYLAIMEDASLAEARAEVARRLAEAKRRGEEPPSSEEQERLTRELERARRPWPLDPVLVGAVVLALVAGVVRGAREQRASSGGQQTTPPPSWRIIGGVAGALAIVVGIILVVRQFGAPH